MVLPSSQAAPVTLASWVFPPSHFLTVLCFSGGAGRISPYFSLSSLASQRVSLPGNRFRLVGFVEVW